jgi:hypothetical protein
MTAGYVGARDVYTPDAGRRLNALGDSLRQQLNELGRHIARFVEAAREFLIRHAPILRLV